MTTIIPLPHGRVGVIEVPEDSYEHHLHREIKGELFFWSNAQHSYDSLPLPPGQWTLIGVTPLTEEQAGMVVERNDPISWKDYTEELYHVPTAYSSFASLLTANNLPTDKRLAVLWESTGSV